MKEELAIFGDDGFIADGFITGGSGKREMAG
jgi:hypothetical protein